MAGIKLIIHRHAMANPGPPGGKFVQLQLDHEEIWLFSHPRIHRFHNQIVAWYLKNEGIPHQWENDTLPLGNDRTIRIRGGGRFAVDRGTQEILLWGDSSAFGRFHEEDLSEKWASANHPWSQLRLRVG